MIDPQFYTFVEFLWRGGSFAYFWTPDTDSGNLFHWVSTAAPADVPKFWTNLNCYFSVHPSRISKDTHSRGSITDVESVNCLFAEFDPAPGQSKAHLLQSIMQMDTPPTVIIDSGRGFHCYWLLHETFRVDSESSRERIKLIQYAWIDHVGGDPAAKDLARVLRIPGSFNRKPELAPDFPQVAIEKFDLDLTYDLADLEKIVAPRIVTMQQRAMQPARAVVPTNIDDQAVIEKLRSSPVFDRLWAGDLSVKGGDHSKCDFMLAEKLAFYTGRDQQRMDAIFRQSGLYREKWERADYRNETLERAIQLCSEVYTGRGSNVDLGNPEQLVGVASTVNFASYTNGNGQHSANGNGAIPPQPPPPTGGQGGPSGRTPQQPQSGYNKPDILINNRQLSDVLTDVVFALVARNQYTPSMPIIFARGNELAEVVTDTHNIGSIRDITCDKMRELMTQSAQWFVTNMKGIRDQCFPSVEVGKTLLAIGNWPYFPIIDGVVSCPTFAPDGTMHDSEGYSPATQLYYTKPLKIGDTAPTTANIEAAKKLILDDLFVNFPFKDNASKAHAVALLLLPFVRPMIDGATPMHLVDAPEAGTGKGLLADLCGIVAQGEPLAATSSPDNDEEWRKKLTSILMTGGSHIAIDNIPQNQAFGSAALATALTQQIWEDRLLGTNRTIRTRVRAVWVATGNNVQPSKEIARRIIWIRLDANMENPQDRKGFKHPKIREWAKRNRSQLVTACLTLIRAWLERGRPLCEKSKGSFESWAAIVGGILEMSDIPGFLENENELMNHSVNEQTEMRAFITEWVTRHSTGKISTAELFVIASYPDDPTKSQFVATDYANLLENTLGAGKEHGRKIRLGNLLAQQKDRVIAGYKILQAPPMMGKPQWTLIKV